MQPVAYLREYGFRDPDSIVELPVSVVDYECAYIESIICLMSSSDLLRREKCSVVSLSQIERAPVPETAWIREPA